MRRVLSFFLTFLLSTVSIVFIFAIIHVTITKTKNRHPIVCSATTGVEGRSTSSILILTIKRKHETRGKHWLRLIQSCKIRLSVHHSEVYDRCNDQTRRELTHERFVECSLIAQFHRQHENLSFCKYYRSLTSSLWKCRQFHQRTKVFGGKSRCLWSRFNRFKYLTQLHLFC